jgi:hypothetical protein
MKKTPTNLDRIPNQMGSITRFWSEKWGDKIVGWWIDGVYHADQMYRNVPRAELPFFRASVTRWKPEQHSRFQCGTHDPLEKVSDEQDYTQARFRATSAATNGMYR